MKRANIALTTLLLLSLVLLATTGCGASPAGHPDEHPYRMASLVEMPGTVQQAPLDVRQAYQFAALNQDVLEQLPCYCGCGAMGHASNYSCYVSGKDADGYLTYDEHALECRICVDITQDAMRMLDEGKPMAEIATYIDATYAEFGPPTLDHAN